MKQKLSLVLSSMLIGSLLFGCGGKNPTEAQKYSLDMDYKEDFKILWLTDIHYGQNITNRTLEKEHLKGMIEEASSPDLIVLTGDTFWEEIPSDIDDFIDYIDSFNIPWAFTYGNHDLEPIADIDPYYINRKIDSSKNKVFVDYENDDITGLTNYFINLKDKEGNVVYRLYILDSNNYNENNDYDCIHEDQLKHFKRVQDEYNDKAPTLAFYHIPIYEYKYAYDGYKKGTYEGKGENNEDCCVGYKDTGAFNYFSAYNVIGSFCGHDHINYSDIMYNNMILSYGLKSSDLCYHDDKLIGYKTITLPKDYKTFNLDNVQIHYYLYS